MHAPTHTLYIMFNAMYMYIPIVHIHTPFRLAVNESVRTSEALLRYVA